MPPGFMEINLLTESTCPRTKLFRCRTTEHVILNITSMLACGMPDNNILSLQYGTTMKLPTTPIRMERKITRLIRKVHTLLVRPQQLRHTMNGYRSVKIIICTGHFLLA